MALAVAAACYCSGALSGTIPAAHVYHNHMPNFWPFYGVDVGNTYNATAIGAPVRYMYDGQVINLKTSPPAGYSYYLPTSLGGAIMPHDDLVTYYTPDAKVQAYQSWPQTVAGEMKTFSGGSGQVHVTMSAAVVNNVNSMVTLQNVPGYSNVNWGQSWRDSFTGLPTTNGFRTLDTIHFSGHHSMGPLVGPDYFLKDLIYQNVTLAQSYFLGNSFAPSNGFFPTELGFSERLIPTLAKLGVKWSVLGNNHFSRTLKDYPYATYDATGDTIVSPPNRADLRNTSSVGSWVSAGMAHEQQNIVNKYPFASTPHWVRHVDAATGAVTQIAGIPVTQNGSWLEGWEGSTTVDEYLPYAGIEPRQFFVVAHDGDNSGGRAGSIDTWRNGHNATCVGNGYCLGIDEYLKKNPIPASDIAHVQDGSWVDTRDSSSDPTWYHWHLPPLIWKGQFSAFNLATGSNLAPKKNLAGLQEGATVSLEYGWHYLERNFALLQAAINYAKTAEQIWLDAHPAYWSPTTPRDNQVTHSGNQLNPWMMSYPLKGDAANDYAGGANPAELAWYFLLPAMDSGFGYYDENKDDSVKPVLAMNNSLYFAKQYVSTRLAQDKTGPSLWWTQRYPYNPGSVNASKAEGWTVQHYSKDFAIYTYAHDVSGISDIQVKVRPHLVAGIAADDDTYKVYDPVAMQGKPGLSITPANVGAWVSYPMQMRDLRPSMNGVAWNAPTQATMQVLPAQETGNLYYTYFSQYRNQLLDYYIEATDTKGNVTKSEIQQVYVGAGTYTKTATGSGYVEDSNGTVAGVYPFLVIDTDAPTVPGTPLAGVVTDRSVALSWTGSQDNVGVAGYQIFRDGVLLGTSSGNAYVDSGLSALTTYAYKVLAFDAAGNQSKQSAVLSVGTKTPDTSAPGAPGTPVGSIVTSSSVHLSWPAATDNYGVALYLVYRNGVQIGTSTTTAFDDSALAPASAYSYTIKAQDAAGNLSLASSSLGVSTLPGNVATVYYKLPSAWSLVNIHYAPTGGTWTTVPGLPMKLACTGWYMYSANLSAATGAAVAFNNGAGIWDANNGKNYALASGISALENGVVSTNVNPCNADTTPPTVPGSVTASAIDANSVKLSWLASTDTVGVLGYTVLRGGSQVATGVTGNSYIDNTVLPSTAYSYTVKAYDAAGNQSSQSAVASVTTPAKVDVSAPSVPGGLLASNIGSNGLTLSWNASSDNVGVANYLVLRNGVQVMSTAATSFTDAGLAAGTSYSYTVKAVDAVGNTSAASSALVVGTTVVGGNKVTVYYQTPANWSTVNVHYAPTGGAWTAVPGIAMNVGCAGWKAETLSLGSATGAQLAFNNGAGVWDSKNGANYSVGTGIAVVQNGTVGSTNPCTGTDTTAPSVPSGLAASNLSATGLSLSWSASTDAVGVTGYKVLRNGSQIGSTAGLSYADIGLMAGSSYSYTVQAYDGASNLSAASAALVVATPAAGSCAVTFTIANANTASGQNLYVVGNQVALGNWTPASGYTLLIQGSGANVPWSGTVNLPANSAIQYKYVKWNGSAAVWESNQTSSSGNRELATPASCASPIVRNDGNFKP
jgi:chitodextrinase